MAAAMAVPEGLQKMPSSFTRRRAHKKILIADPDHIIDDR
jgi:hypothetical protein